MAWNQVVWANPDTKGRAGFCLGMSQDIYTGGANTPQMWYCAYQAWEASPTKHADYNFPEGVAVPVWWSWWGTIEGEYRNWGHVAVRFPDGRVLSSPGNAAWGADWFDSVDAVERAWRIGLVFEGWTEDIGGLTVVSGSSEPLAGNQRITGGSGANRRSEPSSDSAIAGEPLSPGTVGNFVGWAYGNDPYANGNNVWFQGISGNWFYSGAFTDSSTNGLTDLNAPAPVVTPPAPVTPAVSGTSRTVGSEAVNRRAEPNTNGAVLGQLAAGTVGEFDGWARGENVNGVDIWYRGALSGNWFWAGAFTTNSTEGLPEVTSTTPAVTTPTTDFVYKAPTIKNLEASDIPAWIKYDEVLDNELTGETEESWNTALYEYYNSKSNENYQYEPIEFHAHWWGDPANKPKHDATVNYLKNKDAVTVNYVVSANRITSMVPLTWMATTTGARNPWAWKAEIDPSLTDDVYKTVAALMYIVETNNPHLANEPIRLHKEFNATACSNVDTVLLRAWVNKFANGEYDINTGKAVGGSVSPVEESTDTPTPTNPENASNTPSNPVEEVVNNVVDTITDTINNITEGINNMTKQQGPTVPLTEEQYRTIQVEVTKADTAGVEEVSNYNLFSKAFWNYSGERIIKTFAMTASGILSTTGVYVIANPETANVFSQIGWVYLVSVAGVSALNSFLVALSNFKDITTLKKENNL